MIQGGPDGHGTGGLGYNINSEFNDTPHVAGVLSMARSTDPDSAGSQFFICLKTQNCLNKKYTAFGQMADEASMDVVRKIGSLPTNAQDRPQTAAVIESIAVICTPV